MTQLINRFISGIILFTIFILSFFSKIDLYFLFFISLISIISLKEMNDLLMLKNFYSIIFWFLPLFSYFLYITDSHDFFWVTYISSFFWIFIASSSIYRKKITFNFLLSLYGFIIIFSLLISVIYLFNHDKTLLLITFIIIWISDIFAYLAGKKYGKRKLAPSISPGKTIEGVCGAIFANIIFIIVSFYFYNFSIKSLIFLVFILLPFSIMGDLFESLLKRISNKKDSGKFIPGHGGFLDRIDGLCSTLPLISILSSLGFVL